MRRRRFDPVSFVAGQIFLTAGVVSLVRGEHAVDLLPRLAPLALVWFGIALVASGYRRRSQEERAESYAEEDA